MPIQWADKPKQPTEILRYEMTFVPNKAIAVGDALTGTPTVDIVSYIDGVDVSSSMIVLGSVQRVDNTIYVKIQAGDDGDYKITFRCGTVNGELVEEDLVVQVKEY